MSGFQRAKGMRDLFKPSNTLGGISAKCYYKESRWFFVGVSRNNT